MPRGCPGLGRSGQPASLPRGPSGCQNWWLYPRSPHPHTQPTLTLKKKSHTVSLSSFVSRLHPKAASKGFATNFPRSTDFPAAGGPHDEAGEIPEAVFYLQPHFLLRSLPSPPQGPLVWKVILSTASFTAARCPASVWPTRRAVTGDTDAKIKQPPPPALLPASLRQA